MKRLLTMLVTRSGEWWQLRASEGDPPEEREYLFGLTQLIMIIKSKLTKTEAPHEKIDP